MREILERNSQNLCKRIFETKTDCITKLTGSLYTDPFTELTRSLYKGPWKEVRISVRTQGPVKEPKESLCKDRVEISYKDLSKDSSKGFV
jgi:hypothetical protein